MKVSEAKLEFRKIAHLVERSETMVLPLKNMMRFQMHFSLDENERKRSLNPSEKVVLRTSETSTIEQP